MRTDAILTTRAYKHELDWKESKKEKRKIYSKEPLIKIHRNFDIEMLYNKLRCCFKKKSYLAYRETLALVK